MTIQLDHVIMPSHTKDASAKLLGELLGVPCGPAREGPFFAVYVNDGLNEPDGHQWEILTVSYARQAR